MGTLADLQNRLLAEVGTIVVGYGFDSKPRGQSFRKSTAFGWVSFHLAFIRHPHTDFDVTGDVAVRFDEVERLVNEDNKLLTKPEKAQTATLGAELGNIQHGQPIRWKVITDTDVKKIASQIAEALARIGLPYLNNYSNLERAFATLSSNEPSSWRHSPIHGARCQRAIALAFLLKRYDQLGILIKKSEAFLKSRNDFGLRSFQQFAEKLRVRAHKCMGNRNEA